MEKATRRKDGSSIKNTGGFTLIELLIVVAIIGILAAIAIPNFLEAQTRSKTARVQADLQAVATGLESYLVDNDDYPPQDGGADLGSQNRLILLTTPIAYLTITHIADPFCSTKEETGSDNMFYKYRNLKDLSASDPVAYTPQRIPSDGLSSREGPIRSLSKGRNSLETTASLNGTFITIPATALQARGMFFVHTRKFLSERRK